MFKTAKEYTITMNIMPIAHKIRLETGRGNGICDKSLRTQDFATASM